MDQAKRHPGHVATPEYREAVRSQIVAHGEIGSVAIAAALDLPHATVVRILQRFEAVGGLRLVSSSAPTGAVEVEADSLSTRFRDLSLPLW